MKKCLDCRVPVQEQNDGSYHNADGSFHICQKQIFRESVSVGYEMSKKFWTDIYTEVYKGNPGKMKRVIKAAMKRIDKVHARHMLE